MRNAFRFASHVNGIALLGALLGLTALNWPFVVVHPNRVMPGGEAYSAFALHGGWGEWIAGGWLALAIAAVLPRWRGKSLAIALTSAIAAVGCVAAATWGSTALVAENEFARMSISGGAWLAVVAMYVAFFSVYHESPRLLVLPLAVLGCIAWFAPYGHWGVVREYAVAVDTFHQELVRHGLLVAATLPLVVLIGLPLGVFAVRKPRVEGAILGIAGFLQTVPSIALFGLLLPLLSGYGRYLSVAAITLIALISVIAASGGWLLLKRVDWFWADVVYGLSMVAAAVILLPALGLTLYQLMAGGTDWLDQIRWSATLDTLGVRGLGATPAIVALTLYGIWPLIVNTHTGLKSVPAEIVEAAQGMGMSARQIFWQVEMLIAAPFFIQGIRGALLLLIGLASIAVLVNAGGLGYFLMRGTEQAVSDLVLLGSLPVVLLALAADALTRLLARGLVPKGLRP